MTETIKIAQIFLQHKALKKHLVCVTLTAEFDEDINKVLETLKNSNLKEEYTFKKSLR